MKTQLLIPEWMQLSKEVRQVLIDKFNLKRDISTEVDGQRVVCDGYSNEMLKMISIESMESMGAIGNDFEELLNNLIISTYFSNKTIVFAAKL